jgi:hypothetical protein
MQKTTYIILLITILLQVSGRAFMYVGYRVNKETIALQLCEKKTEKANTCEGLCFLKKEIQKETRQTTEKVPECDFSIFYPSEAKHAETARKNEKLKGLFYFAPPLQKGHFREIYHPPLA